MNHRHLHSEDRLAILQNADTHRKWYSLDDQRVCVICDKAIRGRQIDITFDKRGNAHLHCPTPGCQSTPHDWFYRGNAVFAKAASKSLSSTIPRASRLSGRVT